MTEDYKQMKQCSVEGCNGKHEARGYCNKHYKRLMNRGTVDYTNPVDVSPIDRLYGNIFENGDCWEWKGTKTPEGYGRISIEGKNVYTHRLSYELHYGEITGDLFVCHKCDNRACVNPKHLFLGTQQDNINDMISKNRSKFVRGDECGSSKLKKQEVLAIKEMLAKGITQKEIAEKFNVTSAAINKINVGENWGWLNG